MKASFVSCILIVLCMLSFSCRQKEQAPSAYMIKQLELKRGEPISCGPAEQQFGTVAFPITGSKKINRDFDLGVKLLHSFEYDEAKKVFAKIIDAQPQCAMAYWGVAMSNFHALWAPPSGAELQKGATAVSIAKAINNKSDKEATYINALAVFYTEWEQKDHRTRCLDFENEMAKLHAKYPDDKEAAAFYALALNAAADPADKSFTKQQKAGKILQALYPNNPNHPGIVHYLIHTYDAPELAAMGLPAARRYAAVAPSSAHALHMPSHIFTRLGLWDECITSNLASVNSAQCYALAAGIKGHWDEELHGMDYLMYAYLQKGDNSLAKKQWEYLKTITTVQPFNFKVAYAFAAIPSRYLLENKLWKDASVLQVDTSNSTWKNFAWQKAIVHFTRLMGAVHINNTSMAAAEMQSLQRLHNQLLGEQDSYKAGQVEIQIKSAEAWMQLKAGNNIAALQLMRLAAYLEDKTEKHPVTPGAVLPARELLGDMLMALQQWNEALEAYHLSLKKNPARFNSLYGAGKAAEKWGDIKKATFYYQKLLQITGGRNSNRPEISTIKEYLKEHAV